MKAKKKFELEKAINGFMTTSVMKSSKVKNIPLKFSLNSYNINFNYDSNKYSSNNNYIRKSEKFITEIEGENEMSRSIHVRDSQDIHDFQEVEKENNLSDSNMQNENRSKSLNLESLKNVGNFNLINDNLNKNFAHSQFIQNPFTSTNLNINNEMNLDESEKLNQTIYLEEDNIKDENKLLKEKILRNPIMKKFLKIFENVSKKSSLITNKLKSKNFTLEYYFASKQILEELIILLILISLIAKLNIFSVIYIIIILIIQIKGKNSKNLFYMTLTLLILILIQYCLILTNINEKTDPTPNLEILEKVKENLNIPWFIKIDFFNEYLKWAFYFSFGTDSYQLRILGYDFTIIFFCFIYLENYSYLIFQDNQKIKNEINLNFLRRKRSLNDILYKISESEYKNTKEILKENFEIEIPNYEIFNRHIRGPSIGSINSLGLPNNMNRKMNEFLNKLNKKTKFEKFFMGLKSFIYLTIHNLVLTLIIVLSILNDGIISIFYLIFSFYHLNKSKNILLGMKTSYPKSMKIFFLYLIFGDLVIQVLYQIPISLELKEMKLAKIILDSIGFKNAVTSYVPFTVDELSMSILSLKAFVYFLCCIQNLIYNSKDFKEFYTFYIFENKEKTFLLSAMNSSLINNKRLETMQKSMDYRGEILTVLNTLQEHLNKWDQKLNGNVEFFDLKNKNVLEDFSKGIEKINPYDKDEQSKEDLVLTDHNVLIREIPINNQIDELTIVRKIIMKNLLIRFAFFINKVSTSYFFVSKKEKEELETAIIKGFTHIPCRIEIKINRFLDDFKLEEILEKIVNQNNKFNKNKLDENVIEEFKNLDLNKPEDYEKFNKFLTTYKNVIIDELNKKIMSTSYILKFILLKIFQYILSNFQYFVYFFMILNHIMNANLISLFYPIVVLCYAALEFPRPKKGFWIFSLNYAIAITIIKFLLQLELLLEIYNIDDIGSFRYEDKWKIGIKIFPRSFSSEFINYVIWDCIVVLFILFEQVILIRIGLWEKTEIEIEKIEEAYDRTAKSNSLNENDWKIELEKLIKKSLKLHLNKSKENYESMWERLFPKLRNKKPGKDFYAFYTIFLMLIIIYIIFFYTNMDQNKIFDMKDKIKIRQFSGTMVLVAFFHVFLAVLDRIIYLKQNRTNLKIINMIYNKSTGEKISEEEYNKIIESNSNLEKLYSKTYLQIEETNLPLIMKYILHILVVIFSHLFIFWYLPIQGNFNLHNIYFCDINQINSNCNDFHYNGYLIAFYILYLFYLIFSSLQIHYGLLDMRRKSLFMRNDNFFYYLSFQIFNAIPFLSELKLMIDWTITPTALDLFKWIKSESIYDRLFITHCNMKSLNKRKVGETMTLFNKLSLGGCGFIIILFILLGPLLLFSNLNPTNKSNNLNSSRIDVSLAFVNDGVFSNFTLFQNSQAKSIRSITNDNVWDDFNLGETTQTRNFPKDQIQVVRMPNVSDTNWILAKPNIETIMFNLKNYELSNTTQIFILFSYSFTRNFPSNGQTSFNNLMYPILDQNIIKSEIIRNLTRNLLCENVSVKLDNFYKPTIHLSSGTHADPFLDDRIPSLNAELKLNCPEINNIKDPDYSRSYFSLILTDKIFKENSNGITFVTFSDLVSETTASYDVIGFYISFILVIGRLIRGFISGEETRIILTEMPEPDTLITLCEGIKISRYRLDFVKEEFLFYVLIDLMRSPEIIKIITKSSIKKLKEKDNYEKKNN